MQKEILHQILEQSKSDCTRTFSKITEQNLQFRLTQETASIGFIFRHIGEISNSLGSFFGYQTEVENSTLGQTDDGKDYDFKTSMMLFEQAYSTLEKLVNETPDNAWLEEIDTLWFGKMSRIKVFSITLFHNSHHCGQIASAIMKGKKH